MGEWLYGSISPVDRRRQNRTATEGPDNRHARQRSPPPPRPPIGERVPDPADRCFHRARTTTPPDGGVAPPEAVSIDRTPQRVVCGRGRNPTFSPPRVTVLRLRMRGPSGPAPAAGSDHRLWETAVLFHLRDAFRAGDVWLARSRRYGDIRKALLSAPAVADADHSLPAPASPHDWLAERRFALDKGLRRLAAAARAGAVAGGSIEDSVLRVERTETAVPDGAADLGRRPLPADARGAAGRTPGPRFAARLGAHQPDRGIPLAGRRPVGHRETLRTLTKLPCRVPSARNRRKRAAPGCSWQLYIEHCP